MDRRFGWMKDEVPVVGQGTWHMGKSRRAEAEALTIGLGLAVLVNQRELVWVRAGARSLGLRDGSPPARPQPGAAVVPLS